ncbi:MAG TPA: hypothetical protein VFF73_33380 [Planctomycetota bacterium]|nr:hypothetical protein [Planctomycetota bacterium]
MLPWWGWVGVVLVGIFLLLSFSRRLWRAEVRRELRAVLEREGYEVLEEHQDRFKLKKDGSEGELFLRNIYYACAQARSQEEHAEVFERFLATARATDEMTKGKLTLEEHGPRIMPRLVPGPFFAQLGEKAKELPRRRVPELGLDVVYVVDSEHAVVFLTKEHVADLALSDDELHELALENLEKQFPAELVKKALDGTLVAVKCMDTYDAARLLLVPSILDPGQELAAGIPDRETLFLAPVPKDGNWSGLGRLAKTPGSEHLLIDRPIKVTREGFELVS